MVEIALQKAEDLFGYKGIKPPDEKRKEKIEGSILPEGLEVLLEQYEEILEIDDWEKAYNATKKVKAVLKPDKINTFLQATIPYEAHKRYAENTGYFITKLIQNSYNAGNNGFKLVTKALSKKINNIGWELKGKKDKPLELLVEGDVGKECGAGAEHSTISITGNAGDGCGVLAKYSTISIAGNAGKECGYEAEHLTISIAGDAGNRCGYKAEHSTINIAGNAGDGCGWRAEHSVFKTPNRETLEKLKKWVEIGRRNKLYFINPDGSEVLEWPK